MPISRTKKVKAMLNKPAQVSTNVKKKQAIAATAAPTQAKRARKANLRSMRELLARVKRGARTDDNNYLRLENGTNRIRFMLSNSDSGEIFEYVQSHFIPTADGKKRKFVSPRSKDPNAYCPASAVVNALRNDSDENSKTLADDLRASSRVVANALLKAKGSEKWEQGILDMPASVARDIAQQMFMTLDIDEEEDLDDAYAEDGTIADKAKGTVVLIKRTGSGRDTRYAVTISNKRMAVTDAQWDACVDLSTFSEPSNVEEMEAALCELLAVDSLEEITGVAVSKKASKQTKRSNGKGAVSDDAEDEDGDETEDEDEDEIEDADADEEESEGEDDTADDSDEASDSDLEEEPECFGNYAANKTRKRGCAECSFQSTCKDIAVVDEDADEDDDTD